MKGCDFQTLQRRSDLLCNVCGVEFFRCADPVKIPPGFAQVAEVWYNTWHEQALQHGRTSAAARGDERLGGFFARFLLRGQDAHPQLRHSLLQEEPRRLQGFAQMSGKRNAP